MLARGKRTVGGFTEVIGDKRGGRVVISSRAGKIDRPRVRPSRPAEETSKEFMVAQRYLSDDGLVDVDAVVAQLGLTKVALAQALGFADETLQRFSRAAAPKTQQRMRDMLEILSRIEPWAGGLPQALGWYRGQGIPALGDQTAEAMVKTDQAKAVRDYLDAFAAGAYA
jgi:hypothetical protein